MTDEIQYDCHTKYYYISYKIVTIASAITANFLKFSFSILVSMIPKKLISSISYESIKIDENTTGKVSISFFTGK